MSMSDAAAKSGFSRRRFLERLGRVCSAGAAAGGLAPAAMSQEENSGPVSCGPPPKAKPQSRTGGESFPPLPLPATPLRRTEKKRPPSPPALIGKAALGPVRQVVREGKQEAYRDWMTDPADINTLLEWTSEKLGIHYRSVETDFRHFSFDPRELPAILLAGHNKFGLGDEVRQKLAQYVADGGTILADACCGWQDFADAFRQEMELAFPGRPLRKMLAEDPLFSSYYKLGKLTYKRGDGSTYEDLPQLESIDFGCRAGVVFSPVDLTCGWDGHEHPRGLRVVIDAARQVGANMLTYLLGNYQLARFLSTSKVYFENESPSRDDFVFAQLVHEGDWDPDPSAVHNLLKHARDNSTLEVKFKRQNLRLKDPEAATCPLLYLTGHREFRWDDEEVGRLQRYLSAGGLLLADACCGRMAFDAALRAQLARVFPDRKLERIPADHPLFHCHYNIGKVDYTPRVREDFGPIERAEIEGISLDGRLAVIYSRFDLGNGWEQFPHPYSYGLKDVAALEIGTNAIIYAITH